MENKNDGLRFTSPLNNRLHKQWGCFKWTFSLWAPKFSSRAPERSGSVPNTFESHAAVSTSSTVTHSPQSWAELVFVSLAYIKDFACTQESFSCPRETIDGNILFTYALDCNCNSSFIYCKHLPLCITVIFSWRNESTDAHELTEIYLLNTWLSLGSTSDIKALCPIHHPLYCREHDMNGPLAQYSCVHAPTSVYSKFVQLSF